MTEIDYIGSSNSSINGWPKNDSIEGLLDALSRWQLDSRLDYSSDPQFQPDPLRAPFRSPARRYNGSEFNSALGHVVYANDGAPIFPEAPNAVAYCGNFMGYSFGFSLSTDDANLIAILDAAIAKNMRGEFEKPTA